MKQLLYSNLARIFDTRTFLSEFTKSAFCFIKLTWAKACFPLIWQPEFHFFVHHVTCTKSFLTSKGVVREVVIHLRTTEVLAKMGIGPFKSRSVVILYLVGVQEVISQSWDENRLFPSWPTGLARCWSVLFNNCVIVNTLMGSKRTAWGFANFSELWTAIPTRLFFVLTSLTSHVQPRLVYFVISHIPKRLISNFSVLRRYVFCIRDEGSFSAYHFLRIFSSSWNWYLCSVTGLSVKHLGITTVHFKAYLTDFSCFLMTYCFAKHKIPYSCVFDVSRYVYIFEPRSNKLYGCIYSLLCYVQALILRLKLKFISPTVDWPLYWWILTTEQTRWIGGSCPTLIHLRLLHPYSVK